MNIGRWIGNYIGWDEAAHVYGRIMTEEPWNRRLQWNPQHTEDTIWVVVFDQMELARTLENALDRVPQYAREHIEVWEAPYPSHAAEPLNYIGRCPGDRVLLQWTEVTGTPEIYRVYRLSETCPAVTTTTPPPGPTTTTAGPVPAEAVLIASFSAAGEAGHVYTYTDGPLGNGHYCYWITMEDETHRVRISNRENVYIAVAPLPPSNLRLTIAGNVATLDWDASPDPSVTRYSIRYGNPLELPHADPAAFTGLLTWSQNVAGLLGRREWLVRALAGDREEANLHEMVGTRIEWGTEVNLPNSPEIVEAWESVGGQVTIQARYYRRDEAAVATELHLYTNNGLGGPIVWGLSRGTAALETWELQELLVESTGLVAGRTYLCAIRARTAGGVEDENRNTVEVVTTGAVSGAPVLEAGILQAETSP